MKALSVIPAVFLTGCINVQTLPPDSPATPEETLGVYLLMSGVGAKAARADFLAAVYPLRSQIVTYAMIGFHRDRGLWPASREELEAYVAGSPANPSLPKDALTGLTLERKADGSLVYSTLEDRQRGREFTISSTHEVTFPVPSHLFASPKSAVAPVSRRATISFDWTQSINDAIQRVASGGK